MSIFRYNSITSAGCQFLAEGLKNLPKLKELILNLK